MSDEKQESSEHGENDPKPETAREPLEPKTDAELRQLALDIMEGRVFGTWAMDSPADVPLVFMPLALMGPEQFPDPMPAHVYEYLDKAGRLSVNGMPTFFSCQFLTQDDAKRLNPMLAELQAARDQFLNKESPQDAAKED